MANVKSRKAMPRNSEHHSVSEQKPLNKKPGSTQRVLVSYQDLPGWYQENEFIHHNYRPVTNSVTACFKSLTYFHNESVNIYSHLVPAVITLIGEYFVFGIVGWRYPDATWGDNFVFAFHLFTAIICFALSSNYHILMNHSQAFSDISGRFDYAGIIFLIFGDFVSGIYVGFYCEPLLQKIYWTMITLFSTLTAIVVLNPVFQSRRFRLLRLGTFTATGFSAFIPIFHALMLFPIDQLNKQSGLKYYYTEGAIILLSALIYATRIPESLRPGQHDLWGASHQIFHALVVVATVVHFCGIWSAFQYNYTFRRCRNSSL